MAGTIVDKPAAASPAFDCFYIYPTVDLSYTPGNHTDFSDVSDMLEPTLAQAAPFRTECRVFAPLYRQVTIGTIISTQRDSLLAYAYADVEEAFRYYLQHYNNGRPFVIMGHSQGSWMARQIMQDIIDPDPNLRSQMIAALLIGGDAVADSGTPSQEPQFQNIPVCQSATDKGCVIAYRTYQASNPPTAGTYATSLGPLAAGEIPVCVNPASPSAPGTLVPFTGAYLPVDGLQFDVGVGSALSTAGVTINTPFALYENFYSGQCAVDSSGYPYVAVSATGATAGVPDPIDYSNAPILMQSSAFGLGLHVLDYSFPLQDLLDLVATKASS